MAYDSILDEQIGNQLLEIEDDLLDISIVDRPTLESFVARLARVTEETTRALKGGNLSPKTIHLARNVALSGKLMADKLSQLHRVTTDIVKKRECEIADVFARMSLRDKPVTRASPPHPPTHDSSSSPGQNIPTALSGPADSLRADASDKKDDPPPSYIANAREWLKKHFYNPYPTYQEKLKILGDADVPIKTVDSWFTNARRRIGWSALTKRFFRNSRSELIDCAFRVFVKPDPAFPVKQEIAQLFKEIEVNVERFYSDESQISEAARALELIVGASGKENAEEGKKEKVSKNGLGVGASVSKVLKRTLKPSDANTPAVAAKRSRSAALGSHRARASLKRKADLDPDAEEGEQNHQVDSRLSKRNRSASHVMSDTSDVSSSAGPSTPCSGSPTTPVVSFADVNSEAPCPFPEPHISNPPCIDISSDYPQNNRKRWHSDIDGDLAPLPKRLRNAPTAVMVNSSAPVDPTPIASVSDDVCAVGTLPGASISSDFPGFSASEDIESCNSGLTYPTPGPVVTDKTYLDGTLEVHPFNWMEFAGEGCLDQSFLGPSLGTINSMLPPQHFDLSAFELPSFMTDQQEGTASNFPKIREVASSEQGAPLPSVNSDVDKLALTTPLPENFDTVSSLTPASTDDTGSGNSLPESFSWDALGPTNNGLANSIHQMIPPPALAFSNFASDSNEELTFTNPFSSAALFDPAQSVQEFDSSVSASIADDVWTLFRRLSNGDSLASVL